MPALKRFFAALFAAFTVLACAVPAFASFESEPYYLMHYDVQMEVEKTTLITSQNI